MVFIQPLIIFCLIISYFFGQLFRLKLFGFSFPGIDIFIVALTLTNIINKPKLQNKPLLYFIVFAWLSFVINYFIFKYPIQNSLMYLVRLTSILSFFIFPINININFKKLFFTIIIANIIFGLIQYIIWPDLTYFKALGWDDHLSRLVSTYLDPTFTALIYLMFFIHLYFIKNKSLLIKILLFINFVAIAFTYSRSTFLSFLICSFFVVIAQKKLKLLALSIVIIISTVLLLPRPPGEGTKLERTSSIIAKNINFQEGIALFFTSPIIGRGYNNLPIIKQSNSHSSSGFDSSIVTLLTTTGIIGLTLFIFGFYKVFKHSNLEIKTMFVAILVHSLFANSLLYPFTLLFLILI